MRLDAFDYHLPAALIAQTPLEDRSASRLLVVDRATGGFEHAHFRDLSGHLGAGDGVVVNRSRGIPARLFVRRETGARVELLNGIFATVIEIRDDGILILEQDGTYIRESISPQVRDQVILRVAEPVP